MTRAIHKLPARRVATIKKPGRHSDGGGLYLQVRPHLNGSVGVTKSWLFRFMIDGRAREMGLGSLDNVSLAEARQLAADYRKQVRDGIDPINKRIAERTVAKAANVDRKSFEWCAGKYISAHSDSWKNAKHRQQWSNTLETYVYPVFGDKDVRLIETSDVLEALEPIWSNKTETATRVRQRIEAVLDWAAVREYRAGDNPARWRGHLDKILAKPSKLHKPRHHNALPYEQISTFMADLREEDAVSARALEFLILTASRTGEVIGATWAEIDQAKKIWVIPAERMKAEREHRVPLTAPAMAIVKSLPQIDGNPFIFPGLRRRRPLSNMAMLTLLGRMGYEHVTAHGFRSTFRDWAAEQTNFPREVAERALAHRLKDKTEEAYQRGDLFRKRRHLMEAWAKYCDRVANPQSSVTSINARKAQ